MQNKKRNIIIIIASAAAVALAAVLVVHVEKNEPENKNQVVFEAIVSEELKTDTESKEPEVTGSANGDMKSERADVQKPKGNNAGASESQEEISGKNSETIISGETAEEYKAGENIVQEVIQNEKSGSIAYKAISSSSGTIYLKDSDVDKVEYGVADDDGDYDKSEPESKAPAESESKPPVNPESKPPVEPESKPPAESESKPPVNPESKPSVEPESESEAESETGNTESEEPTESDIDLNTIIDYDTYESLTAEERTEIRKSFDSIIAYNDWLQQLIQKRNNKITEGAVGYGEEILVE